MDEDLALRGNPDAIRRMAYRRLMGRGMPADPAGAWHDFQAAAAQVGCWLFNARSGYRVQDTLTAGVVGAKVRCVPPLTWQAFYMTCMHNPWRVQNVFKTLGSPSFQQ